MRTTIGEGQNKTVGMEEERKRDREGGRASTGLHDHLRQEGEGKRTGGKRN